MTQKFLEQLEEESTATRKMLCAVPDGKFDWKPHPKSMSIRELSSHIAEIPGWITIALNTDGLDVSQKQLDPPVINTSIELLEFFEKTLTKGRSSLQNAKDNDLVPTWTMRYGDRVISVRPKEDVVRMCMSQIIHHRAQLGVFLRLLDVPIPGPYGPSADEKGM
jgi:uncharacterized damage-inducible protein DinB